jgi:hypothetical protein
MEEEDGLPMSKIWPERHMSHAEEYGLPRVRALVGSRPSDKQLMKYLERTGGCVSTAAHAYWDAKGGADERAKGGSEGSGREAPRVQKRAREPPMVAAAADLFAMALPLLPSTAMQDDSLPSSEAQTAEQTSSTSAKAKGKKPARTGDAETQPSTSRFQPKKIFCRDCGTQFIFSAAEQQALAQRGHTASRTRCEGCASYKKNRFQSKNRANR